MKIAITSTGTTMNSEVDPRFGRSPYVAFVDLETGQLEALANPVAAEDPVVAPDPLHAPRFEVRSG